jgi:dihydropteroate synthase
VVKEMQVREEKEEMIVMNAMIAEMTGEVAVEEKEEAAVEAEKEEVVAVVEEIADSDNVGYTIYTNWNKKQVIRNFIQCYNRKEQNTGRCRRAA